MYLGKSTSETLKINPSLRPNDYGDDYISKDIKIFNKAIKPDIVYGNNIKLDSLDFYFSQLTVSQLTFFYNNFLKCAKEFLNIYTHIVFDEENAKIYKIVKRHLSQLKTLIDDTSSFMQISDDIIYPKSYKLESNIIIERRRWNPRGDD